MSATDLLSTGFLILGGFFFFAGTVGLLRFPDVYTRLHVLAKADNLGLGFTFLGLLLQTDDLALGLKMLLVWLLVLIASAAVSFLIARRAQRRGIMHWHAKKEQP